MLTGGQVRSFSPSGAGSGAASAGSSDFPPKRLLKRSPSDCDDAGEADMPQIIPDETAANTAILQYLFDRATVMTTRLSPMRRPWYLTSSDHRFPGPGYNSAMAANPRRMS